MDDNFNELVQAVKDSNAMLVKKIMENLVVKLESSVVNEDIPTLREIGNYLVKLQNELHVLDKSLLNYHIGVEIGKVVAYRNIIGLYIAKFNRRNEVVHSNDTVDTRYDEILDYLLKHGRTDEKVLSKSLGLSTIEILKITSESVFRNNEIMTTFDKNTVYYKANEELVVKKKLTKATNSGFVIGNK